jgi:hypothetical protein
MVAVVNTYLKAIHLRGQFAVSTSMPSAGDVFNHGGADFLGTIFGGMAWC